MTSAWIDTHVHIFAARTQDKSAAPELPEARKLHTAELYLSTLSAENARPKAAVVVDFSKTVTSEHVIDALEDFHKAGLPARGVIKANPFDSRTLRWLDRDDISGVRFYALADVPDLSEHPDFWHKAFTIMRRRGQHMLVFGAGENLLKLVEQLPEDIPIVVDHLGLPNVHKGTNDHLFRLLISTLRSRQVRGQEVYVKGPGYRTSMQPKKVLPFITAIVDVLGVDALMLGASDAPFAGPVMGYAPHHQGKNYADFMTFSTVLGFVESLIDGLAVHLGEKSEDIAGKLLHDTAQYVYGFTQE